MGAMNIITILVLGTLSLGATPGYRVVVDPSHDGAFIPAATAMAALHGQKCEEFDPGDLDELFSRFKDSPPSYVVFVIPPEKIDVNLSRDILSRSTSIDEDPFVDFEYGFVTGRDGAAASRFVAQIAKAGKRKFERRGVMFGSWEGMILPPKRPLTAAKAMGLDFEQHYVWVKDDEEKRREKTREVLQGAKGVDTLLFFSHGYPDEMVACFKGPDLSDWKVELPGTMLVNCCCYGGAPGQWWEPRPGAFVDRGKVKLEDSVALALLDSGISSYFAGIDPWHGWLANEVYLKVVDDGMGLGEAAKNMADRLALDFLPERIHFKPASKMKFEGEGTDNRRRNGAGMIFYGDPAQSPYGNNASRLGFGRISAKEGGALTATVGTKPLIDGYPSDDFLFVMSYLTDYYSVKTQDIMNELAMEIYRVIDLPDTIEKAPAFKVISAKTGDQYLPTGTPQCVMETTADGKRKLHVRVPIKARPMGTMEAMSIAQKGVTIELEE